MIVLGIDPGSQATGFAAVGRKKGRFHLVEAGVIRTKTKNEASQQNFKKRFNET